MTTPDTTTRFSNAFESKPVLAMVHLMGDSAHDRLQRALREIQMFSDGGVDGVIIENYFGDADDVEHVFEHLTKRDERIAYGVNVLDDDARTFEIARRYGASFIQLDSVAGHLAPDDDAAFAEWLSEQRASVPALVLGGVRFKYQPVLSGNSLKTDLCLATERCDAIVVTGDATGMETNPAKIASFREILGPDFPLITGAGVTVANCVEQLAETDGMIIGSYLKDTFAAEGEVSADHIEALMTIVRRIPRGCRI